MSPDTFDRQIEAARQRLEALAHGAQNSADPRALVVETLEELSTALEELHVAAEQLRQQNEELAATRQRVEEERQRYQDLFELAPDGYLVTDPAGVIREANRAAATLLGVPQEFLVSKPLVVFVAKEGHQDFRGRLTQMQQRVTTAHDWQVILQSQEGTPFPASLTVAPVHDAGGRMVGLRWLVRDISERKEAEDVLRSMSEIDELTGLHNRRSFLTLAPQYLKMADRNKIAALLLFADLDGLKSINDTLGHSAGDRALTTIAHILKKTFRQSDILARMGGDEFAVLAMETPVASAEKVVARLQESLDKHNVKSSPHLLLSLGVARYDHEHRCSVKELLAKADAQMYEQKRSRRGE
jgi:diguanylate cyclase (GGDEF)-like protein/PAS domain S-box-containing protein